MKFPSTKGLRICSNCGEEFQPSSNAQKYCSRDENAECDDERYFKKLWKEGKHPAQIEEKFKTQLNKNGKSQGRLQN